MDGAIFARDFLRLMRSMLGSLPVGSDGALTYAARCLKQDPEYYGGPDGMRGEPTSDQNTVKASSSQKEQKSVSWLTMLQRDYGDSDARKAVRLLEYLLYRIKIKAREVEDPDDDDKYLRMLLEDPELDQVEENDDKDPLEELREMAQKRVQNGGASDAERMHQAQCVTSRSSKRQ